LNGAGASRLAGADAGAPLSVQLPREWPLPGADEVFRGIYTRAGVQSGDVLAVCSAIAGEGKTTIGVGLGVTLAQDFPDRHVLLVETDLQRPVLAADFQVEAGPGLAECLLNGWPLEPAYRPTLFDNLQLLPAGGPVANPSRLLRSSRMAMAVDAMRQSHDVVILDLPAVLVTSDALLLSDLADGVILVVRAGVTPASLVAKALEQFDEDKLRGVVLNGAQSAIPRWLRRLCGL
jgi:receptor protein-tyrosine kinase